MLLLAHSCSCSSSSRDFLRKWRAALGALDAVRQQRVTRCGAERAAQSLVCIDRNHNDRLQRHVPLAGRKRGRSGPPQAPSSPVACSSTRCSAIKPRMTATGCATRTRRSSFIVACNAGRRMCAPLQSPSSTEGSSRRVCKQLVEHNPSSDADVERVNEPFVADNSRLPCRANTDQQVTLPSYVRAQPMALVP